MKQMMMMGLLLSLLAWPATAQQWELAWSDEFEQDGLPDPAKWGYDVGAGGWGNQELQFYTEARPENVRVEGGVLVIEARKETFQNSPYTSARLVTRDRAAWTYGRFEIRARLPSGRGTWPAIWLLYATNSYGNGSWPDNGEIDIMEHVGFEPDRVHAAVHVETFNGSRGNNPSSTRVVPDAETEFHVYSLEWSPRRLTAYVDDALHFTYENRGLGWPTWPFDQPFYLILNTAVGGTWGGQQGIDDSIFPQAFEVDYVRVYRNAGVPAVALTDASVSAEGTLTLAADASDADGSIAAVQFFQGDGLLGEVAAPPFALGVPAAQAGCYALTARAVDDEGWESETDPTDLTIGTGCPQAPYLIAATPLPGPLEAEYFDLGGQNVAYLDLDEANNGGGIRLAEGVDIEPTRDVGGGHNIGWITSREWLAYTVNVQTAGRYRVEARVASLASGGSFSLAFDGEDKTGEIAFPFTGGWQMWQTITHEDVFLDAGLQTMRLNMRDGGFNLNWLRFVLLESTATEDDAAPQHRLQLTHFPNPFRTDATVVYDLAQAGLVMLDVYDVMGRRVATLVRGLRPPGRHEVAFDASGLPAGLYYYRLQTPAGTRVRTMTRLP